MGVGVIQPYAPHLVRNATAVVSVVLPNDVEMKEGVGRKGPNNR